MPFQSEAQRRWMWANEPEMAQRWQEETPKGKLPKRKKPRRHAGDRVKVGKHADHDQSSHGNRGAFSEKGLRGFRTPPDTWSAEERAFMLDLARDRYPEMAESSDDEVLNAYGESLVRTGRAAREAVGLAETGTTARPPGHSKFPTPDAYEKTLVKEALAEARLFKHGDHDQSEHGNWARGAGTAHGTSEFTETRWGVGATPIDRGPGPVMSLSEAKEFAADSVLPGPWFHGGTGRSGMGARIWEDPRGMDTLGRGYYLSDDPAAAGVYARESGVVREAYLAVDSMLEVNSPEFRELWSSDEAAELMATHHVDRMGATQVLAQRQGYQGWFQEVPSSPGRTSRTAVVFDASRVATVDRSIEKRSLRGLLKRVLYKHTPGGVDHDQSTHAGERGGRLSTTPWVGISAEGQSIIEEKMAERGVEMSKLVDEIVERVGDDSDLKAEAMRWYPKANEIADDIAEVADVSTEHAVGLVAVLSPRADWDVNVDVAQAMADFRSAGLQEGLTPEQATLEFRDWYRETEGKGVSILPTNIVKGFALLDGADVDETVTGPKVRSFFNNILEPGVTENVTVDAHMYKVFDAVGFELQDAKRFMGLSVTRDKQPVVGSVGYTVVAEAVRLAGEELGMAPDEVQAAYWLQIREETGDRWPD